MASRLVAFYKSRPRLFYALAIGLVAGFAIPVDGGAVSQALVGWNVATWFYLVFIWTLMHRADEQDIRQYAKNQDENAWVILVVLSAAALASLVAIVFELGSVGKDDPDRPFHVAMALSTVLCSWLLIPTVFGLHYAHEYYADRRRRATLVFPDADPKPDYWDFMYFSFTLAVAFATSDIQVSKGMRRLVLAQQVIAFFFNASILAFMINIAAGLLGNK